MSTSPLGHRHRKRAAEFTALYGPVNKLLLLVGVFLLKTSVQFAFFSDSLLSAVAYYVITVGLPIVAFIALQRANPARRGSMRGRNDGPLDSLFDSLGLSVPSFDVSLPSLPSLGSRRRSRKRGSRRSSLGGSQSLGSRIRNRVGDVLSALPLPGDDMDRL
ncbi:hypothetical protein [Haloarchaeobius sp. DFWS5]|uniref:hypothetical protein n=1 Tax=Haloarchaeobius sp. DFWS5 TaxID=3446114 RepID=UPI003EC03241